MATTALVTEILIVGLQAEAWIAMFVLAAFGIGWVDLDGLQGWAALVTVLVLATAYVLGIVVDRLADNLFRLRKGPDRPGFGRKRLAIMHASPGMASFLEYQRSRFRVARGTLANLYPATVAAALLVWRAPVDERWIVLALGLGVATIVVTRRAAERIAEAYEKRLLDAYSIVKQAGST